MLRFCLCFYSTCVVCIELLRVRARRTTKRTVQAITCPLVKFRSVGVRSKYRFPPSSSFCDLLECALPELSESVVQLSLSSRQIRCFCSTQQWHSLLCCVRKWDRICVPLSVVPAICRSRSFDYSCFTRAAALCVFLFSVAIGFFFFNLLSALFTDTIFLGM